MDGTIYLCNENTNKKNQQTMNERVGNWVLCTYATYIRYYIFCFYVEWKSHYLCLCQAISKCHSNFDSSIILNTILSPHKCISDWLDRFSFSFSFFHSFAQFLLYFFLHFLWYGKRASMHVMNKMANNKNEWQNINMSTFITHATFTSFFFGSLFVSYFLTLLTDCGSVFDAFRHLSEKKNSKIITWNWSRSWTLRWIELPLRHVFI